MSISKFMGILKGKSSLMIFDRFANLKYKYGNRHFWCRGYYVDTVGRNKTAIAKYIQNQIEEDKLAEQLSMKEYIDPFTGEPTKESKKEATQGVAAGKAVQVSVDSSASSTAGPMRLKRLIKPPA